MRANPDNKEQQIGLMESFKNMMKGDYENMNPMIKKIFFMIAELFRGKEWFQKMLGANGMKKLAEFYAKEFKLSAEKKDEVEEIYKKYQSGAKDQVTDNTAFKAVRDIFDEKVIDFNAKVFKKALENDKLKLEQLDPTIIQDIVKRKNLQGLDNLASTNNTDGKLQIDPTVFKKYKDDIIAAICEDEVTLKAVKNAYLKSGMETPLDEDPNKKQADKDAFNANARKKNGENVAIAFSAYLVAGSKEHFYNVLVENKFEDLNVSKKENDKLAEDKKTIEQQNLSLKTANEKLKTDEESITKSKEEAKNETDPAKKTAKEKAIEDTEKKYKETVFANLKGIYSNDIADQIKNNDKSPYAMLCNNTNDYTELYSKENIKSFLETLQSKLAEAEYEGKINTTTLTNAIKTLSSTTCLIERNADGIKIRKNSDDKTGFLLKPGYFLTDTERNLQQKAIDDK